ncbi:MAG: zinc ribbon domain-containing protein [Acidimicrobiia bacterium]|nr:zinc ribbon domain-containing protein [Acidimicrobiia bacterium]
MPTYDYRCSTCETAFELNQSFSEDTLKKCPTKKSGKNPAGCTSPGRGRVEKVFSAPGITFKGTGFYKNDSRGSSTNGSSENGSSTKESTSTATSSAGSDSGSSSASKDSGPSKSDSGSTATSTTGSD